MMILTQQVEALTLKVEALEKQKEDLRQLALQSEAQCQRLRKDLGRRRESVWEMRKAELVETAKKELGFTMAKATELTALELRHLVKQGRDANLEPKLNLPKGMGKMRLAELQGEASSRGIDLSDPTAKGGVRTRASLMLAIRSYEKTKAGIDEEMSSEEEFEELHAEINRAAGYGASSQGSSALNATPKRASKTS